MIFDHKQANMPLKFDASVEWFKFNISHTGFYRVNYPTENWQALILLLVANSKVCSKLVPYKFNTNLLKFESKGNQTHWKSFLVGGFVCSGGCHAIRLSSTVESIRILAERRWVYSVASGVKEIAVYDEITFLQTTGSWKAPSLHKVSDQQCLQVGEFMEDWRRYI